MTLYKLAGYFIAGIFGINLSKMVVLSVEKICDVYAEIKSKMLDSNSMVVIFVSYDLDSIGASKILTVVCNNSRNCSQSSK